MTGRGTFRRPAAGQSSAGRRRVSGRRKTALLVTLVVILLAAGGFFYLRGRGGAGRQGGQTPVVEYELEPVGGDRAVVLVFPNWDASGYVTEERRLPSHQRLEDDLMGVMGALCSGPTGSDAVASLPAGTRPLAAFYDESDGSVVLDFSRELVTHHPGGSAAEQGTLTSILRTIALNFPEVQHCLLLVDGAQSETLAGHLSLDRAFSPRRWL